MTDRALQFRVGALVCGIALVFATLVLFLVGSAIGSVNSKYYVEFEENVKGMVIGSKVNFQGVPIGAVSDIRFVGGLTAVELTVDRTRASIQEATRARLDRLLVTGQVTIELEGYERGSPALRPGATILTKSDPLNELKTSLPEIVQRVESALTNVDRLVASANRFADVENSRRFASILANVERVTATLPNRLDGVMAAAEDDLRALHDVIRTTEGLLEGGDVQHTVSAARLAMERIAAASASLESFARDADATLASLRTPLQSIVLTARESLREIQGLARKLRLAPRALLFGEEQAEIDLPAAPGGQR